MKVPKTIQVNVEKYSDMLQYTIEWVQGQPRLSLTEFWNEIFLAVQRKRSIHLNDSIKLRKIKFTQLELTFLLAVVKSWAESMVDIDSNPSEGELFVLGDVEDFCETYNHKTLQPDLRYATLK